MLASRLIKGRFSVGYRSFNILLINMKSQPWAIIAGYQCQYCVQHAAHVDISIMSAIRSRSSSSTTTNVKRPRTEGPMTVSNPAQLAPRLSARLAARKGWKDQPKWVDFYNHWWGRGEENVEGPGAVLEI